MAAAESAGIDVEGFKFVSFKEQSEDCRKITRKRHLLNLEAKEFYPPEGHVCFSGGFTEEIDEEYSENDDKDEVDSEGDKDDSTLESGGKIFYLGGSRNSEKSSWSFASSLYYYQYDYTRNDVWIDDAGTVKICDASMPCLSRSACVQVELSGNQKGMLLWGGSQ